ncbi:MAG TPA: hypothetical protein VGG33_21325 [Polyangia bacterium]
MNFFDELQAVLGALEASGIDYALCGGVALAIHGAPRATQGLIALKLAAGRPQDVADVKRLEELSRG